VSHYSQFCNVRPLIIALVVSVCNQRDGRVASVVHKSGTPYCELGYLGFFADLGRTGFTGLTPVIARVHIILLESMQFNVKSQNQETLSYIQRPASGSRLCQAASIFSGGHLHIAGHFHIAQAGAIMIERSLRRIAELSITHHPF
jgi:hypothetical protein